MAYEGLNCRGDRRGMNGRVGPRSNGGRFVSSKDILVAPVPTLYSIIHPPSNETTCPSSWAQVALEHKNPHKARPTLHSTVPKRAYVDCFDDSDDDSYIVPSKRSVSTADNASFDKKGKPPSLPQVVENMQLPQPQRFELGVTHASQSLVPYATPMVGVEHIVREAATRDSGFTRTTCHFNALVGGAVLDAFYTRPNGVPKSTITMFRDYMVYQCARDRRSLGDTLLYATSIDAPFSIYGFRTVCNGFTVMGVDSPAMLEECKKRFVATKLIAGTEEEIDSDMALFSNYPFYTLACTSPSVFGGEDIVHAACVFRVHSLNNGHRLIALELLASDPNDLATTGAGTALMQALRALSMLSPRHPGHIAASTLTTKNAREFYARQLPEFNSPQARAFTVSVAFLDVNHKLEKHLDLRCTTVWPPS